MQVINRNDENGTVAIATRPIKAGELILAAKPFVCIPNYENIVSGNYCVGCLAPTTTTNASSSTSSFFTCPSCKVCTFCSSECYNLHYKSQHIASGECKAIASVVNTNHNLKGPNADSLLLMSVILARGEAELKILQQQKQEQNQNSMTSTTSILPQEPQNNENKPPPFPTSKTPSISTSPAMPTTPVTSLPSSSPNPQQESKSKTDFPVVPVKTTAPTSSKQEETADESKAALKDSKKEQTEERNPSDDEEEEDDDDDGDSYYQQLEQNKRKNKQQQQKQQKKQQKKKADKRKNSSSNNSINASKSISPTTSLPPMMASTFPSPSTTSTTTTTSSSSSSTTLPSRVIADIKLCQEAERTCLIKEFPTLFSTASSQSSIEEQMKKFDWTLPSTSSCSRHQRTKFFAASSAANSTKKNSRSNPTNNNKKENKKSENDDGKKKNENETTTTKCPNRLLTSILKQDAEKRREIVVVSGVAGSTATLNNSLEVDDKTETTPTFIYGFSRLISNSKVCERQSSYLSTVETLRRKFNTVYNTYLSLQQQQPQQQQQTKFDINRNFFYHAYSAFCCNSFGIYKHQDDTQYAIGMYPVASYFNHSCLPNLVRRMDLGKVACFYALRDIDQGEYLTISYCDDYSTPNAQTRRMNLLENYRFWCGCELCAKSDNNKLRNPRCSECVAKGLLRPVVVIDDHEFDMVENINVVNVSSGDDTNDMNEQQEQQHNNASATLPKNINKAAITSELCCVGRECQSCFTFFPTPPTATTSS